MVLPIVHYNTPVLRQKGARITVFDQNLAQLAADMVDTMHEAGGIGLAAQQIGRALQLCVIDLREASREFDWRLDGARVPLDLIMPLTLVNPVLRFFEDDDDIVSEEGCLSFPELRGDVTRPDQVECSYQDLQGTPHTIVCDGLFSRCIQHEVDHLNGVLFIERMPRKVRQALEPELKELAKRTRAASGASA